ncbi:hypothetical protein NPIL_198441 [Nephila pilipes]|uniref:Uncharacterized protein n=1 Tax=Nephila pilipes TaxID=299642 RepID=A0A8X6U2Z2_NEPPI|nr:hypothetical protein NPIL_198441 [Nephila pilipes]
MIACGESLRGGSESRCKDRGKNIRMTLNKKTAKVSIFFDFTDSLRIFRMGNITVYKYDFNSEDPNGEWLSLEPYEEKWESFFFSHWQSEITIIVEMGFCEEKN